MTKETLNKIQSYLKQQQEQFGNITFIEKGAIAKNELNSNIEDFIEDSKTNVSANFEMKYFDGEADLYTEQPEWKSTKSLDELYNKIHTCQNCALGATRKNFVFGVGNPNADILIIGEAPGADEDEQGEPFVGKAGQLLTKIIEAINLKRSEVYIANIIKCRPPDNRKPLPEETEQCQPYLMKQIALIKPAFILTLGLTAVDTLLQGKHKMGDMRGKLLDYHGITMLVTYHPAALLRNPEWKKFVWEDVKLLRKLYDEYLEKK